MVDNLDRVKNILYRPHQSYVYLNEGLTMSDSISLRAWLEAFNSGAFFSKDTKTQIKAGWFDWFCRDESLARKTLALAPKVRRVSKSPKIDIDKVYLLFKNNCPLYGSLYDDFRICSIEDGGVVYTVIPKNGHNSKKGITEIWGRENDFDAPLYEGDWKGALKWFGV